MPEACEEWNRCTRVFGREAGNGSVEPSGLLGLCADKPLISYALLERAVFFVAVDQLAAKTGVRVDHAATQSLIRDRSQNRRHCETGK